MLISLPGFAISKHLKLRRNKREEIGLLEDKVVVSAVNTNKAGDIILPIHLSSAQKMYFCTAFRTQEQLFSSIQMPWVRINAFSTSHHQASPAFAYEGWKKVIDLM